jgi:hypothetical protein
VRHSGKAVRGPGRNRAAKASGARYADCSSFIL